MAAIQRGPCPKVLAGFDRRPLAGARGRLYWTGGAFEGDFWAQYRLRDLKKEIC